MGISSPTPIQQQSIPVALAGKDLIASSKTGSGKTLAFLLPALQRLISKKALSKKDPRVLILLPTRELAQQVYSQLRLLTANTLYKSVKILGGENFNDQAKALAKNPHFIVATPGRITDHLLQKQVYLNGLELLILDEADRMLDLGFASQLNAINQAADHRLRQTLMFSATLDQVENIANELLKNPEKIIIDASYQQHEDIKQKIFLCDNLTHKEALLLSLLKSQTQKQIMIFTATRSDTDRLAKMLMSNGYSAAALNGELNQNQRNQIMDSFTRGQQQILVTTDVASRGLDLANISLVINFDMPKLSEEYVHRIGRTGRAGSKGDAWSLVGPKDWLNFKNIEQFLHKRFQFDTLLGLEAKFTGLSEKSNKSHKKDKELTNKAKKRTKTQASNPTTQAKRNKGFHTGVDIGDIPLKKKTPKQE